MSIRVALYRDRTREAMRRDREGSRRSGSCRVGRPAARAARRRPPAPSGPHARLWARREPGRAAHGPGGRPQGTAQVSGGRLVTAAGPRVRRSCRSSGAGRDLNDTSERPAPVPPVGRWPAWGVARQLLGTAYRLDEATSKMISTRRCDNGSPTTSGDRSRGGGGGRCMDRGTPTPLRSRWLPAADPDRRRSRRCCRSQRAGGPMHGQGVVRHWAVWPGWHVGLQRRGGHGWCRLSDSVRKPAGCVVGGG